MDKWTFRKINYNGQRNNRTNLYMHTRSSLAALLVDPVLLLDHHQLSCSLIRIFILLIYSWDYQKFNRHVILYRSKSGTAAILSLQMRCWTSLIDRHVNGTGITILRKCYCSFLIGSSIMTCTSLNVRRFIYFCFFFQFCRFCAFCSCCQVWKLAAHCTSISPAAMLESCDSNRVRAVWWMWRVNHAWAKTW